MKNYNEILKDLLALTNEVIEAIDRNDMDTAKEFIEHVKEGIELNILK